MKHTNKRVLAFALSVLMLLSLLPAGLFALAEGAMNAGNTVYVDQASGSDETGDGTEAKPVQTIEKAVALLDDGDKTADGYLYLVGDYTGNYTGKDTAGAFGSIIDYLPAHTRHIIVTGDAANKPTWTMVLTVPSSANTGWADRHFAGAAYMRNNGPVTLDAVTIYATNDKNNPTYVPTKDSTYTFPAGSPYEGKKFTLTANQPLYKYYNLVDSDDDDFLEDITGERDTEEENIILPVRINDIRWNINGKLVATANCTMTYDTTTDTDRANATIIPGSSNKANIAQIYTQPFSSAVLAAKGNWGNLMPTYQSGYGVTFDDEIVVTIGSTVGSITIYSPTNAIPATTKFTYVIEKGLTVSYPFYATTSKLNTVNSNLDNAKNGGMKCDFTYVIKAKNVKFNYPMIAADYGHANAPGKYNLVIENPEQNFNAANHLIVGFSSIAFKNVESDYTLDLSTLPSVGYETLYVYEGDALNLTGSLKDITLDVVLTGESDSFPVINTSSADIYNALTLHEDDAAIGKLTYADNTVSYVLDRANYAYQAGDTDENVGLPADVNIAIGRKFTVSDPTVKVLADGRRFAGWKDAEGNVYYAGDVITVEEKGNFTLTATWGGYMSFVTGYESTGLVKDDMYFVPGDAVTLPSDLRADDTDGDGVSTLKTITDGGKDYVFYGWTINGEFHHAGTVYNTSDAAVEATAVWVPAIYVKPSYAGGDSDGSKEKPFTSIVDAQVRMRELFGETTEADVPAGSIVMMEDTVWNWSYTQSVTDYKTGETVEMPYFAGGARGEDGYVYYKAYSTGKNASMTTLGRDVLYTALSSDVQVLQYQYESLYFYAEDNFLLDNMTITVCSTHTTSRQYVTTPGKVIYMGPTLNTSDQYKGTKNQNATVDGKTTTVAATFNLSTPLPTGKYSDTMYQRYSRMFIDANQANTTVYLLNGSFAGLYMLHSTAGTETSYIGAPGTVGPTVDAVAPQNCNNAAAGVWNYYHYSGKLGNTGNNGFRLGTLSTANNTFAGTYNFYFYCDVDFQLLDNYTGPSGNITTRDFNRMVINLYFENSDATVKVVHANQEQKVAKDFGDSYAMDGSNYCYKAKYPSGVTSISLKNSNVTFTNPLYVKSGADVTYYQDENSSYTGEICATKDDFINPGNNEYSPDVVEDVISGMGEEGQTIAAKFDGDKWLKQYALQYETGFDGVEVSDVLAGVAGDSFVLSDALDGKVVNDNGQYYIFSGWSIGDKTYAAGDAFVMMDANVTATALWTKQYALDYNTGFDGVALDKDFIGFAGDRIVLTDDLRGQVVTDAGNELTFFGWNIDGKFYDAGDGYVLGESNATATAVWVPAIFVDPTYAGDDSNGSRAKPFVKVGDAYAALKTLLASSDAVGGAVYLLSDAVMDAETDISFAPVSNIPTLEDAGKPVLFTAVNNTIKFTTDNGTFSNTLHILGSVMFDNLTLRVKGTTFIRMTPAKDAYFGPNFAFEQTSGYRAVYLDGQNQNVEEVTYKIYDGKFDMLVWGSNLITNTQVKLNIFVGTGNADSNPTIGNVAVNAIACVADAKVEFRSGTVTNLVFGTTYGNATYKARQPIGNMTCVVYEGMTVGNVRDAYSDATNYLPAIAEYCANLSKTLVFDGYKGDINYYHYTNTNTTVVNGINNVSFIGGAQVNFTNQDVVVVNGANASANVYIEAGSSYTGNIQGSCIHDGAEMQVKLTPANGFNAWNSDKNHTWTNGTYGAALGAQKRTVAPHGIRFGFAGSTSALEAMLGQALQEKGVLLIPTDLLEGDLNLNTADALKVEAKVALSLKESNVFTAMLVDDLINSDSTWLDKWNDVEFTACAYFKLDDDSVVYSNSIVRCIADIDAALLA